MPYFTSGGREIYYERHGSGPAVVFLHGAGSNAATWWQQLGPFSRHHTCFIVDQRCFGRSLAHLAEFRVEIFARDVIALLDAEGIGRATLLGQSLGGMACLRAALDFPQRVEGLVLCDTSLAIDHPGQLKILRDRVTQVAALTIEQRSLGAWFLKEKPELAVLYGQINHFNPSFHRQDAVAWSAAMQGLNDQDQLTSMDDLRKVGCPTLIVVGEADPIVPVSIMEEVQALIPDCQLEVVPRAAHSAYFEQPEIFNTRVLAFLAQKVGR